MGIIFSRASRILFSLAGVLLLIAACAPNPRSQLISPDMVLVEPGEAFVPPTPTPEPRIDNLTDEEIFAGLPADVAPLFPGDVAAGQNLSVANGCVGCHNLDPDNAIVAPTWNNMANTAVGRALVSGSAGPADYLYSSIVAPNSYVVPGYNAGVMPQTYVESLSEEDLVDLVAYLLSLEETSGE